MSNYEYEDEDDDITTNDSSNDLVKQLRKAAKQKDKELQELRAQGRLRLRHRKSR